MHYTYLTVIINIKMLVQRQNILQSDVDVNVT